jgi:hypothetical protein
MPNLRDKSMVIDCPSGNLSALASVCRRQFCGSRATLESYAHRLTLTLQDLAVGRKASRQKPRNATKLRTESPLVSRDGSRTTMWDAFPRYGLPVHDVEPNHRWTGRPTEKQATDEWRTRGRPSGGRTAVGPAPALTRAGPDKPVVSGRESTNRLYSSRQPTIRLGWRGDPRSGMIHGRDCPFHRALHGLPPMRGTDRERRTPRAVVPVL